MGPASRIVAAALLAVVMQAGPDADPLIVREGVTPCVRAISESGAAEATPTSEPWIDSNLWLVRSRRARAGNRPVWLVHKLENPSGDDYARAIAEAAAAGGRWVVTPDQALVAGLWHEEPGALSTWGRIRAALEFQRKHAEWRSFQPVAVLGVIQDRAAADPDMSDENLKLICRRRIPYRVIERADLTAVALQGLKVVLAADLAPPTAGERKLLAAFARDGRTVVYNENRTDPDSLSKELLDLIDIQDLPVRLFNVPSVLPQAAASRDGARLVVELINYATAPAELIVVRVAGEYRAARLLSPGAPPEDLKTRRSGGRTEVRIASVAVYAAVVFEK